MQKSAEVEHEVAELIKNRRSVRSFAPLPLEDHKIHSLFEATRWAPSSTNEQPWTYIFATKGQQLFDTITSCLAEGNQAWAKDAAMLVVSLARKNFSRKDVENAYAWYDLGGANALFALQAVALGLQVRQMAGYSATSLREALHIPDAYHTGAVMAVGYPGEPDLLPDMLRAREVAPRERYRQQEFVMNSAFKP